MDFDLFGNKEILKMYMVEGVEMFKNRELFEMDKEFYYKDLSSIINKTQPELFCWFCYETETLCIESENGLYGRISEENNKLVFFREVEFSSSSPMYLLMIIVAMLFFEGHIEKKEKVVEKKEEDASKKDDPDFEWI